MSAQGTSTEGHSTPTCSHEQLCKVECPRHASLVLGCEVCNARSRSAGLMAMVLVVQRQQQAGRIAELQPCPPPTAKPRSSTQAGAPMRHSRSGVHASLPAALASALAPSSSLPTSQLPLWQATIKGVDRSASSASIFAPRSMRCEAAAAELRAAACESKRKATVRACACGWGALHATSSTRGACGRRAPPRCAAHPPSAGRSCPLRTARPRPPQRQTAPWPPAAPWVGRPADTRAMWHVRTVVARAPTLLAWCCM